MPYWDSFNLSALCILTTIFFMNQESGVSN